MTPGRFVLRVVLPAAVSAGLGVGSYAYLTADAAAPGIITGVVTRGDILSAIAATGTLEAVTTIEVGTQVSGTVRDLLVDFNDIVHKGQTLARLDPSLLQAQIEQAEANVIRAEADAERMKVSVEDVRTKLSRTRQLVERQILPRADLEAAEIAVRSAEAQALSASAQVVQARASLNQVRVNLAHTIITAPLDGIVISRNVDVGQTVAASMQAPTLFVLAADLASMRIVAKLDESDIARVREGQMVSFNVDAYPGESFTGRVAQVRLLAETVQNVVTYATVIDVPNERLLLRPGMTANLRVEVARREQVLRVPASALRFAPSAEVLAALGSAAPAAAAVRTPARTAPPSATATIWRAVGTTIERIPVQVGIGDGTLIEVTSDRLQANDRVVTSVSMTSNVTTTKTTSKSTVSNPLMGTSGPPPPGMGGPR